MNNLGIASATVAITLMDKDGAAVESLTATVPPKGSTQIDHIIRRILGTSQVTQSEGWIRLLSDQEIFGWTSQIDNMVQDPSFVQGRASGAPKWLIPSVVSFGGFRSTLVVVTLDSAQNTVELVARDNDGSTRNSITVVIPGAG